MNALLETGQGEAVAHAQRSPVPAMIGGYLGDLVAWQFARGLHPFKAPRSKVADIFFDAGFAACLDTSLEDPARAMSDAARHGKIGGRIKVHELAKPNKDTPTAFGVYFREGVEGEKGDDWPCGARIRVEQGAVVALPPEGKLEIKECMVAALDIAKRANEALTHTFANELSDAIVAAGRSMYWASFRKAGGVYWVHETKAPRIRKLLAALEELGGFWATLQPLFGDSDGLSARNVSMAAESALEAELTELAADLAKAKEKGMRDASLEAREVRCQELTLRISLYRDALAERTTIITQRLERIRKEFGSLLKTDDDKAFELE